jgi:hypothetical protein
MRPLNTRPGPRPHAWLSGPDETRHEQHIAWRQQKNQAQFRGETWLLEFDDWIALWGDRWWDRGRERGCYCMTRRDWQLPWTPANAEVITREAHAARQAVAIAAGWRSRARTAWLERTQHQPQPGGRRKRTP